MERVGGNKANVNGAGMRSLGESVKMMEARGPSNARSNIDMDGSGDVKIFRPTLLRRLGLFFLLTMIFPIAFLSASFDLPTLLEVHNLKSLGDFFEGLAITLLMLWGTIFLSQRQSVVLIAIDHSTVRFKSLFRDFTVPILEGVTLNWKTTSGPFFITFLKVWTPVGKFTLTNLEFNPAQLIEINHLMLRGHAKQRFGATKIK